MLTFSTIPIAAILSFPYGRRYWFVMIAVKLCMTLARAAGIPILIISADREKELYGRYEEQAFFHRLFKLLGHPDVTLYELDGYDHGNMAAPSFPLLLQFIREHEKK